MERLHERIYVGGGEDCFEAAEGWAVVHACRHPCFRRALARRRGSGALCYLEEGADLYLDLVDSPQPASTVEPFEAFLDFTARHWKGGSRLLIHCNRGRSRSPSLALLSLAKSLEVIAAGSYAQACRDFLEIYPRYAPGEGMRTFLHRHWRQL